MTYEEVSKRLVEKFLKNYPVYEGRHLLITEVEAGKHLKFDLPHCPVIYGPAFVIALENRRPVAVMPMGISEEVLKEFFRG